MVRPARTACTLLGSRLKLERREVTEKSETTYTTSEVARELGVTDGTVRRYITSGFLPEPGWHRQGKRRQRQYTEAWVKAAKRALSSD